MFLIAWDWLSRGWRDFRQAVILNIAYAALFLIIGLAAILMLHRSGFSLIYFIVAGGFLLVVPGVVTVYYYLAEAIHAGRRPLPRDILAGVCQCPVTVIVIGLVSLVIYLIWITDALIIYSVYFDFIPLSLTQFQGDTVLRQDVMAFLLFASILGFVLSFIIFCITVLSIPYALQKQAGLVDAVSFSVKIVSRNSKLMISWAVILGGLTFLTVLIALPFLLVVLPVLAYANFAAYSDLLQLTEAE